ncbi:hypothetical protein MCANUF31_00443 [Mycoplasmopsis canis UF31]|uniref:hypothetical protein n=1 Tax=Mycoplasmopsis canis TaxID=29555 RepID=UPI00025AE8A3|nr:hypothetical protein [Mycoplasmopsis canis]EIE40788.1 hypothetical protein MCANUF31_00443 [Mycoplasmopsis canis UF31]
MTINGRSFTNKDFWTSEAQNIIKTFDKKFLIGSPRLGNGEMKYICLFWPMFDRESKGVTSHKYQFYSAALSDDKTKIIIMRIILLNDVAWNGNKKETTNFTLFVSGAREYILNEGEINDLDNLNLVQIYRGRSSTNINNDIINLPTLSEDFFNNEENRNKVSVFGFYIKKESDVQ